MGNICRSPTAHGVFLSRVRHAGLETMVRVASAGTHGRYHAGEAPDQRSQRHALRRGYDLSALRARQIGPCDFERADLILVMDDDNLALAQSLCPSPHLGKIWRLTTFCQSHDSPVVPDPYAGGPNGFDDVLDLVEDACDGLLAHVRSVLGQAPEP